MSNSKYGIERAGGRLALTPQAGGNVLVSLTSTINPDGRLNALSVPITHLKELVDEVYATGEFPSVPYARAYLHSRYGTPPHYTNQLTQAAEDTTMTIKTHHRGSAIGWGETQEEHEKRQRVSAVLGETDNPAAALIYDGRDIKADYDQGRREATAETHKKARAWERVSQHPALSKAASGPGPVIDAVMDRLTQLVETEQSYREEQPASRRDEVRRLELELSRRNFTVSEKNEEIQRLKKEAGDASKRLQELTTSDGLAEHITRDVLDTAFSNAERPIGVNPGDFIMRRRPTGWGYHFFTARPDIDGAYDYDTDRILRRAPRPQTEAEKIEALLEQLDDEVSLGRQAAWLAEHGVRVVSGDE
jgi:hypothetical protein